MKKITSIVLALILMVNFPVFAGEVDPVETSNDTVIESTDTSESSEETNESSAETEETTETSDKDPTETLPVDETTNETTEETTTEQGENETSSSEETTTTSEETTTENTTTTETTLETTLETTIPTTESSEETTTTEKPTEPSEPIETEPVAKRGPILRAPVRATINYLTYENGKYMYIDDMSDPDAVPTAHDDFPYTGRFTLGGNVPIYAKVNIDELYIDTNGYDLIDRCTFNVNTNQNGGVISVQQGDILEISGTGRFISEQLGHHAAVYMNNGGTFNLIDATIEHFLTDGNGAGVSINQKNDVFTMSGNACIKDCTTTASSGGGGVNVLQGKFYMLDNSSVTDCHNIFSNGGEKLGNGAGVQVGTNGTLYMRDYSSITNCSGTGYHGAGVDLWSKGNMYMSGSPTITGNMNGKNHPVNLYIGSIVHIDGELNIAPHAVGISIQSSPVFTTGLKANNPNKTIYELLEMFDADRYYWDDLPRHEEYHIIDQNLTEAKQAPVIVVHFMYNYGTMGEWKSQEVVPGGYATSPGNPTRTGYNFNGWFRTTATTGSAWNFGSNTVPINEDLNLYAKWTPKNYNVTINTIKDGTTTTTTTTAAHNSTYSNVFTADQYYRYTSIKVDNVEQLTDPETSYTVTIPNIAGAHTITLTEVKYQAVVTFNVVDNDYDQYFTLLNNVQEVVEIGSNVDLLYTINSGYYIESFAVEHIPQNSHQVQNVQNDVTVDITIGKQIVIDFTYEGYTNYVRDMYSTAYEYPHQDFNFDVEITNNEYYISEIIINGTSITIDDETNMFIELQNLTEDQNVVIKIAKRIILPDPTGRVLTVLPAIILFAVIFVLLVLTIVFKRRKK